jgi:ribose-phosphate pyrophosphokinase
VVVSSAMSLRVLVGSASPAVGRAVAAALRIEPRICAAERLPDGELRSAVGELRGEDVYVVQPTGPPVNEHLVELLLHLDACRRAGADRVTAVVASLAYARQDRRTSPGEAVAARVVTDVVASAGAGRLLSSTRTPWRWKPCRPSR